MIRRLFFGVLCLLICGILPTTCYKEYFELDKLSDEVELQGDLLAPLVYGMMTMGDLTTLLDSADYFHEFEDGLIYIAYTDTLLEVMADTAVDIQDELVTEAYIDSDISDSPDWIGSGIGDRVPFYKNDLVSFELDGEDRLDSVLVKGGTIFIEVSSTFKHAGFLTISSSEILDANRDTFSTMFVISQPDGTFTETITIPSDGYALLPKEMGDSTYVQINYKFELINSGNPIAPTDECNITTTFDGLGFYSVFGHIDSRNLIEESGELDIPIYADYPELSSIIFGDPRINVFTSNSVGVPFEITLDSVIGESADGSKLTFEIDEPYHPFTISAPGLEQLGSTTYDTIRLNRETSNIDEFMGIAPTTFSYRIQGRTDPNSTGNDHFILDTSRFSLAFEVLLPLDLKSSGFALQDTLEFELEENGVDTMIVKFALVTVSTTNELPIDLELQVYMLDSLYTVLDSVFDGQAPVLAASQVDQGGRLVAPSDETSSAPFPTLKLAKLEDVRYVRMQARMVTSESGDRLVKFYSDYTLKYKISMLANVRINTREL
jgi:hypothetical protein